MLFTRCPHCNTTFRITAEALSKADGQVRCGRCVNVFNAYAELREQTDAASATASAAHAADTAAAGDRPHEPVADGTAPVPALDSASSATNERPAAATRRVQPETVPVDAPAVQPGKPATGGNDTRAQPEAARDELTQERPEGVPDTGNDGATRADSDIHSASAGTADTGESDTPLPKPVTVNWNPDEAGGVAHRRSRLWSVAASIGALALLAQITHHFRADVAAQPLVGPLVQNAYAFLGAPVAPRWSVEQYRILEWIATAEPLANGEGNLAISARIHNRGPEAQPFPHVLVRLKDRWETTIGSRVFAPHEYLSSAATHGMLMPSGETTRAELTLIDPGPDAYGFELDVCVEHTPAQLRCGTDDLFR